MAVTTNDCRKFIVDQVRQGNISANWACDRGAAEDEVANEFNDEDIKAMDKATYEKHISHFLKYRIDLVEKALTTEKNWKRRSKYNGEGDIRVVREFMCDTPDTLFDGQVGYRVLELLDGSLSLGEDIGD